MQRKSIAMTTIGTGVGLLAAGIYALFPWTLPSNASRQFPHDGSHAAWEATHFTPLAEDLDAGA